MIARLIFWCALLCLLPSTLHAQSTEADLKSRLIDRPLYLRGFWSNNDLHFDSSGRLLGTSDPFPFTLSGFALKKVRLKPDKLILEGHRMGLELSDGKQRRVDIQQPIHIEIAASPDGNYLPALDAIFVDGLANLIPSLPFYWKKSAANNFLPLDLKDPGAIPSNISHPKILYSESPMVNQFARDLLYFGTTTINFWVEPDGTVSHLSVLRPLGLGLDENAMIALQHYRFAPARKDGKPITVQMNVVVKFEQSF